MTRIRSVGAAVGAFLGVVWVPIVGSVSLLAPTFVSAETLGEVNTAFKLIGPDHKIVIEAYDDPKVSGVACYVSRAKTGGVSGALGLAEDKSEDSIACRQVGPISFKGALPRQ